MIAIQSGVTLLAVVWFVFRFVLQVDWNDVLSAFENLEIKLFFLSFACLLLSHVLNMFRWFLLLDENSVSFWFLVGLYGVGVFSNNLLPTGVGGDAVRVALLGKKIPMGRTAFSIISDRIIGLSALSVLLGLGLILGVPPNSQRILSFEVIRVRFANIVGFKVSIMLVVITISVFIIILLNIFRKKVNFSISVWLFPSWTRIEWLRRLSVAYLISILSHLLLVCSKWILILSLGEIVDFGAAVWIILLLSFSLLLPISVNGLGLVEGLYVLILSQYGVATSIGVTVALLARLSSLLLSGLGGGLWLLCRREGSLLSL
jgi:hypothetical protein